MNNQRLAFPDSAGSRLQSIVATVDREIARLTRQNTTDDRSPPTDLLEAWADLIDELALGRQPAARECPVCKHLLMRTASVCSYCWTKLSPPA